MSVLTVTKTKFIEGIWEGVVTGGPDDTEPAVEVLHLELPVPGVVLEPLPEAGRYLLKVPVPKEVIGDGIHTFIIRDRETQETLADFAMLAGEALADTMRGEIDLLREELDLLKRAFRRHCVETA
ncbi:MAG: hypothetical protein ACRBBU_05500 [Pseudooceanicola sp.]